MRITQASMFRDFIIVLIIHAHFLLFHILFPILIKKNSNVIYNKLSINENEPRNIQKYKESFFNVYTYVINLFVSKY